MVISLWIKLNTNPGWLNQTLVLVAPEHELHDDACVVQYVLTYLSIGNLHSAHLTRHKRLRF